MSSSCFEIQRTKRVGAGRCRECGFEGFSERVSNFSLGLRAIRPLEFFGARKKVVLRGEDNAWTPVLGVFDKLREVGVSSYLSFTLCLSVFTMFELIEVVSGRLICPKTWDQNVRIFGALSMQSVVV